MNFCYSICLWNVSSKSPAILIHHAGNPRALLPPFHGGNILVNPSPCSSLTAPKFYGKTPK